MKSIVFGGTGFLGSHTVEQLLKAGHEVTGVVRASSQTAWLEKLGVQVHRIDFQVDQEIQDVIAGQECVFNCLANPRIHQSEAMHREVEVDLTRKVVACAVRAGARRFVQLSTIQVYGFGRPPIPIDESFPCAPEYGFGQAALAREKAVIAEAVGTGLDLVLIRPSNATGSRDTQFLPNFAKAHRSGFFPAFGDLDTRFSCIDARDVGRAMHWAAEYPAAAGETYLVKGYELSWGDLKRSLDELCGKESRVFKLPTGFARGVGALLERIVPYGWEPPLTRVAVATLSTATLFDDSKIRAAGFAPRYGLTETLEDVLTNQSAL